jgi:hypothetical protein
MKEFEQAISSGFFVGVLFSLFVGWVIVDKISDAQTPITWCESIAEASKTEPYKVVYDRCYAEYEERKKND